MKVAVGILCSLLLSPAPSEACSPIANPPFALDPVYAGDTTPPTPITVCEWVVRAAPKGGSESCDGMGSFLIYPDSSDDATPGDKLGYVLHEVGQPAPPPVKLDDGALRYGFDATRDVVDHVVRIVPVDLNGNQGKAMRCTLNWTRAEEMDGGGCASTRGGGLAGVLLALLALRRRATRA